MQIANSLAAESVDGVAHKADAIAKPVATLDSGSVSGEHAAHYKDLPTNLEKAARSLAQAKTLDDARESFKKLSMPMPMPMPMPMAMWVTMSKPK